MDLHYSSRKYRQLVEWIAFNDNSGENDSLDDVSGYITVVMLSHCYKLPSIKVAEDVLACRRRS